MTVVLDPTAGKVGSSIETAPRPATIEGLTIGLLGAPFFLSAEPLLQIVGSLLFLTHSILDGCDGELARLKFQESPSGARLDFWGDNLVHVAVFGCMAGGWTLAAASLWPLLLGALAITGRSGRNRCAIANTSSISAVLATVMISTFAEAIPHLSRNAGSLPSP